MDPREYTICEICGKAVKEVGTVVGRNRFSTVYKTVCINCGVKQVKRFAWIRGLLIGFMIGFAFGMWIFASII